MSTEASRKNIDPQSIYTSSSSEVSTDDDRVDFSDIVLTDIKNQLWTLGNIIGDGSYAEIYLAKRAESKFIYVAKVEKRTSKGLKREIHFYLNMKEEEMEQFKQTHGIEVLGIPKYFSHGKFTYKDVSYRFMVLERLGKNLEKILRRKKNALAPKRVFILGIKILYILEFMHGKGYVHNDIKSLNLLFENKKAHENKIYLVDYGLVTKLGHDERSSDQRCGYWGTNIYASLDIHMSKQPSPHSDLESLGYNLIEWLWGKLPWGKLYRSFEAVKCEKEKYMNNIPLLIKDCCLIDPWDKVIEKYFLYIANLNHGCTPNYEYCRSVFRSVLTDDDD